MTTQPTCILSDHEQPVLKENEKFLYMIYEKGRSMGPALNFALSDSSAAPVTVASERMEKITVAMRATAYRCEHPES